MKTSWYQFSLRRMLFVIAITGMWCGWNLNWIHQRSAFLAAQKSLIPHAGRVVPGSVPAPGALSLFGEKGVSVVGVLIVVDRPDDVDATYDWESHPSLVEARRLFPEAEVTFGVLDTAALASFNNEGERLVREMVASVINQFPH